MKGYKIRGKPLEKIFRQKRLFRQSHTQSIALEADLKRLLKSPSRSFRSHLTVAT